MAKMAYAIIKLYTVHDIIHDVMPTHSLCHWFNHDIISTMIKSCYHSYYVSIATLLLKLL